MWSFAACIRSAFRKARLCSELAAKKELVYAFFTLPYFCKAYKPSILKAKAVVMAYEGTPLAQKYAAQAHFRRYCG